MTMQIVPKAGPLSTQIWRCNTCRPSIAGLCHKRNAERGAVECYWGYVSSFGNGSFRNVICLSVNDAAQHGLPHDCWLRDGDVLSLDFAVSVDGWLRGRWFPVCRGAVFEFGLDHECAGSQQRFVEVAGVAWLRVEYDEDADVVAGC